MVMPVFSSGQSVAQVADTWAALGTVDLIYAAGGGIMAHPGGPADGVAALARRLGGGDRGRPGGRGGAVAAGARRGARGLRVRPLPEGPVVAWYGDDFTGSAAVMEVLAFAGLPAALFLDLPRASELARFPGARAIGVAGDARTRTPDWMRAELPRVFAGLRALGAPVTHYKICSTLDSAPQVGSIGAAAEIGLAAGGWAPLVVAAPQIGRWQAFGNLFARAGGSVHRLDRHPTMSVHPVTPMDEADVARHVARQTALELGLVDLVELKAGRGAARLAAERARGARIVAFDVVDDETLAEVGRLIWDASSTEGPLFAIGSQGVEYALVAAWRAAGVLPASRPLPPVTPVARLAAVSGSCSPVTAEQIDRAEAAGFEPIAIDAARAVDGDAWDRECARAEALALASLGGGRSPIVATARGPGDPAIAACDRARDAAGVSAEDFNARVGAGLGGLLDRLLRATGVGRAVIAGGDTSSHGARALGLFALTAETAVAAGAALLRGHSEDQARDGLEITLKGGQMGPPDFFARIRDGGAAAA